MSDELIDYTVLPAHLHKGLEEYIERGRIPGDFLVAVISNNLMGAFSLADEISKEALNGIVQFMWNAAPSACWGSKELMTRWSQKGGRKGPMMVAREKEESDVDEQ